MLQEEIAADRLMSVFLPDGAQPGLYVMARRGWLRFVFEYQPPAGGRRRRMQFDDYGAITLEAARSIAQLRRLQVVYGVDSQTAREEEGRRR